MKWLVPEKQKLIQFLQKQINPAPSGKTLRRVLDANLCRVNGKVERFGTTDVDKGTVVELSPDWKEFVAATSDRFNVIFEDDHLLVVNKPSGWVCTDDECNRSFGANRFLVHRLDKETTGLLLLAKSKNVRDSLIKSFVEHKVEKLYVALVDGVPEEKRGSRKSFFAKIGSFEGQTRWGSKAKGLYAETHWKVLLEGKEAALVLCQPITGRTHQIRVHLAETGHPILVDRQYAERFICKYFAKRILLHAVRLRFPHPVSPQMLDLKSPLPADLQEAATQLLDSFDAVDALAF